jgi:hypothetical protein
MSELTAQCDSLKEKIRDLEADLARNKQLVSTWRQDAENQRELVRQNCDTKMELLKILGFTAEHLGVSQEGTNQVVSHRIWEAVNELRRDAKQLRGDLSNCTRTAELKEAIKVQTEGVKQLEADCEDLRVLVSDRDAKLRNQALTCEKLQKELAEEKESRKDLLAWRTELRERIGRSYKLAGGGCSPHSAEQLDFVDAEVRSFKEARTKAAADLSRVLSDQEKYAKALQGITSAVFINCDGALVYKDFVDNVLKKFRELGFGCRDELSEYHRKYNELETTAERAMERVGLVSEGCSTKHDAIKQSLERLSEAAHNDTVDARMKELEQVCYAAETRSGIMCREENPWRRVKYMLENLAAEIARSKVGVKVHEKIKGKVWAILTNLGVGVVAVAGDARWSDDVSEVLDVLGAIEKKAYEAQNVRAACLKLKELL